MGISIRIRELFFFSLVALTAVGVGLALWPFISPQRSDLPWSTAINMDLNIADNLREVPVIEKREKIPGYKREAFGDGWARTSGPDLMALSAKYHCLLPTTRDLILATQFAVQPNDFSGAKSGRPAAQSCKFIGSIRDPYSPEIITAKKSDIDHLVPLAAAWDLGAAEWDPALRKAFANDPLNLVAVSAQHNRDKSDKLPAQWLPPDLGSRCWYARRLAAVFATYPLRVPQKDVSVLRQQCIFRKTTN
ncbi:HNH endonuclease family protein [Corynebacterium caspium]|uniref:HNH endonuclease family protein n=1 Tax=Corynebacterium caspium TaxID=234828 RepID=UPI00036673F9|nr:HNH endonuclease family protein [Corynebacterium caspium]WKD59486.1 hypothetical protein CCASP_05495 [Corynebacterium caspium DSM 44850]